MKSIFLAEIELGEHFHTVKEAAFYQMNQLLAEGKIQTYGTAQDHSRVWVTLIAESDFEAWEIVSALPVNGVVEPIITPLATYNQSLDLQFPAISLN